MLVKKKVVKKNVRSSQLPPKPKVVEKEVELVCITCINRNRIQNIVDGECLTCKQGNRKSEFIKA